MQIKFFGKYKVKGSGSVVTIIGAKSLTVLKVTTVYFRDTLGRWYLEHELEAPVTH